MKERVIVVGGGMAGLSAALELSDKCDVTLLEPRKRFGGRILTSRSPTGFPFELGAEFIHGCSPTIWRLIKSARLETQLVPDRHWKMAAGSLVELPDFWEQLASVTEAIEPRQRDRSFAEFISHVRKPAESIQLARGFVEQFHAAPIGEASTQAMRLNEESSEKIDGQRNHRLMAGFDRLVRYLENCCREAGVDLQNGTEVVLIDWSRIPLIASLNTGAQFTADRVIITLPIGVLQGGNIKFTPRPESKFEAIHSLGMGIVTKVILSFRVPFWPDNFGFIHLDNDGFSTWWDDERGEVLTAWAGGPNGEWLAGHDDQFIVESALEGAAQLFGVRLPHIRKLLVSAKTHNWMNDPFAGGAYSFVPVHGKEAARELARPEQERLFFAGEATDLDYQFGTVHGAIASGLRVARDVKACCE